MAAFLNTVTTEEKGDYFRLQLLIIDVGTMILRLNFDQIVPSGDLQLKLNDPSTRKKFNKLRSTNVITSEQWDLLYPPIGQPDSAKFDISLLSCLLLNTCGLKSHPPRWVPPSMDTSIEADIIRIRMIRNEIVHRSGTSMNKQNIQTNWNEMEQVMLRLGTGIPSLKEDIENLKCKSLDPDKEKEYERIINEWEEMDKSLQQTVSEMNSKLQEAVENIDKVKVVVDRDHQKSADFNKTITAFESKIERMEGTQQEDTRRLEEYDMLQTAKLTDIESKQKKIEQDVKEATERMKTGRSIHQISPELESLFSMTKMYLEDTDRDDVYVETTVHAKAKETLQKTHCLILTGLPGEGKTTLATKLISEITNIDSVLKLREPSDWKLININQIPKPDLIFIDDIFGAGFFDESLHRGWSTYLLDMEEVVRKGILNVIITTRHYILKEAKENMRRSQLFNDENVIILDSTKLTFSERTRLLEKHLKHAKKEFASSFIQECDLTYFSLSTRLSYQDLSSSYFTDTSSYIWGGKRIGFPEIVSLFVSNEQLYKQGPAFFEKPAAFFKQCMEDLFQDEEKYLALILIWSQPNKMLRVTDLDLPGGSKRIESTTKTFGFEFKTALRKVLRKSLQYHKDGFLKFDSRFGTYSFWHNIVKDMVGLVAGQEYPEAVLEYADKEFIMQYVTTDNEKDDGFHLYIEEYRFEHLLKTICGTLLYYPSQFRLSSREHYIDGVYNQFVLTILESENKTLNVSSLRHDCFSNRSFIAMFFDSEDGKALLSKPAAKISRKVTSRHGFRLGKQTCEIYLPTLALYVGNVTFLTEYLKNKFDLKSDSSSLFLEMSLIIAAHFGIKSAVDILLDYGAVVNENVISVASLRGNVETLSTLLEKRGTNNDIMNSSNPLIAAAIYGKVSSAKCLIDYDFDVNFRDENDISALDEAVRCRDVKMCRLLLEKGANVNARDAKYKRTPLHIAADLGERTPNTNKKKTNILSIAELLLGNGASVFMQDYRGHYPIHCSAIRNHNYIVEMLLKADISQASLRITSYGSKSVIKGMDLFHIAVWKNNIDLIDILLQNDINPNIPDFYGRTPFYRAVYEEKQEIMEKLLRVANVRQAEKRGFTPLHVAVFTGNTEMVKLICPFADVNARDKFGKTPLHTACEMKDLEIFRILAYQADIRMLTNKGQTIFGVLKNPNIRTTRCLFEKFRQIVESIDNEFAYNWERSDHSLGQKRRGSDCIMMPFTVK